MKVRYSYPLRMYILPLLSTDYRSLDVYFSLIIATKHPYDRPMSETQRKLRLHNHLIHAYNALFLTIPFPMRIIPSEYNQIRVHNCRLLNKAAFISPSTSGELRAGSLCSPLNIQISLGIHQAVSRFQLIKSALFILHLHLRTQCVSSNLIHV